MTSILSETFAPPMMARSGRFGLSTRRRPGSRAPSSSGSRRARCGRLDARHRAVGAVGGAEGVVHVDVAEPREARRGRPRPRPGSAFSDVPSSSLTLPSSSMWKRRFSSRTTSPGLQRRRRRPRPPGRRSRRGTATGLPRSSASSSATGLQRVLGDLLAVGPAEVAHEHQARRPCSSTYWMVGSAARDALVVRRPCRSLSLRDVEIDAHEDALARRGRGPR